MNKYDEFLRKNGLRQVDLVEYLGVTRATISSVVKGKSNLSAYNFNKILNNDRGWNTSMLTEEGTDSSPHSGDCQSELLDSLRKNIALLEDQVSELKKDKEELREWIKELTRQKKGE